MKYGKKILILEATIFLPVVFRWYSIAENSIEAKEWNRIEQQQLLFTRLYH